MVRAPEGLIQPAGVRTKLALLTPHPTPPSDLILQKYSSLLRLESLGYMWI